MKVKIKKLTSDAVIPKYAKPGDAGMDLVATTKCLDSMNNFVYGTGIAVEIPEGYVGLLFPRSSNSKQDLLLCNSVGVIDSGYRGELIFKFKKTYRGEIIGRGSSYEGVDTNRCVYDIGDRVGQIVILPYPQVEFEEVEELSSTERGGGGFGHTGK